MRWKTEDCILSDVSVCELVKWGSIFFFNKKFEMLKFLKINLFLIGVILYVLK